MGVGQLPNVVNGYKWELYNIAEDYSENNDLAAKMPDKLRNMQELFLVEAPEIQRASRSITTFSNASLPRDRAPPLAGLSLPIPAKWQAYHRTAPPTSSASLVPSRPRWTFRKAVPKG